MKILILGYARSGKDTLAKIWEEEFGLKHKSSSEAANEIFIFDALKDKYGYKTKEECFEDRVNKRKEWYNLISAYNINDKSRLARKILEDSDIYVGLRAKDEVEACIERSVFDTIVWVDAEQRVGKEDSSSCTVDKYYADVVLDNNSTKEKFKENAILVGEFLGLRNKENG